MPRKKLIRSSQHPYHITSRSNNQEWFYIPMEDVWRYSFELLKEGRSRFAIEVEAYVLMSNHYHLCLRTPMANIDLFMQFFNKKLGERISRQAGRINRIFGAPYKWSLITTQSYYLNVIRYIYQNPIRANLCSKCEDYPFSDFQLNNYSEQLRDWINQEMVDYEQKRTRKNLRKFIL